MAAVPHQPPTLDPQVEDEYPRESSSLNTDLLRKLCSAVDGHAANATFACGGSIPVSDLPGGAFGPGEHNISPSVTIRFDSRNHSHRKLSLPMPLHDNPSQYAFESGLFGACEQATFGVGGRNVLDENYRKAYKLDKIAFCTDFHAHDCGIIDAIQQLLLPSTITGSQGVGIGSHGVRAELYKLNVCSYPSQPRIMLILLGLFLSFRQVPISCRYSKRADAIWFARRMFAMPT